jgi:hypothetical protein
MRQACIDAAKAQLSELVPGSPASWLVGRGSLDVEADRIDAVFTPEVELTVAALIGGESEGLL